MHGLRHGGGRWLGLEAWRTIKRERKNQGREGRPNLKKGRERRPIKWKRKNPRKACQKASEASFFDIFPRIFLFHCIGHPFVLFSGSVVPLFLDSSFPSLLSTMPQAPAIPLPHASSPCTPLFPMSPQARPILKPTPQAHAKPLPQAHASSPCP